MAYIAGSHDFLKEHGYRCERTGPQEWTIYDDEDEQQPGCAVTKARSHADAVRALLALRFED